MTVDRCPNCGALMNLDTNDGCPECSHFDDPDCDCQACEEEREERENE